MRRLRIKATNVIATVSLVFLLAPFVVVVGASFDTAKGFNIRFPPRDLTLRWYRALPAKYIGGLWISVMVASAAAIAAGR